MPTLFRSVSFAAAVSLTAGSAAAQDDEFPRVTLDEAIARALVHNPTVEVATAEMARAEALVRQSRASWLPTLTGNGVYTHLDSPRLIGGAVAAAQDQLSANLTLAVPIIAAQRWVQTGHAKDNVDVQRINVEDLKRQVTLATGRAYLAVIAQKRVIDANERARDTARAHFAFARERLNGGVGNRLDDVRAEEEMATAESDLQAARSGLAQAREALGVLVGVDTGLDAAGDPSFGDLPEKTAALSSAETIRPDVRAQRRRAEATRRLQKDDWADYMPSLTGIAQPFYQRPATLTTPETGWQVQLVLSVPFYDGGLRYGLADEREALVTESRASLEGTLRQARSEVRAAYESVKRADDSLVAAKRAAELSHIALDLANQAYRAGATTNLELIDAERRARDADASAAVAEDRAGEARLELLVASGRFPK